VANRTYTCSDCGHRWQPRSDSPRVRCPLCRAALTVGGKPDTRETADGYCPACDAYVIGARERFSLAGAGCLTLITCGLGLPLAILAAIGHRSKPYLCTVCDGPIQAGGRRPRHDDRGRRRRGERERSDD